MNLQTIISAYLNKSQIATGLTGGTNDDFANAKSTETEILMSRLNKNSRFNDNLIVTYVIFLALSFILLAVLIWYFLSDKILIISLMGGEGLSIVFIVRSIKSLYKDKIFTDLMLYTLPKLSNESEKVKYMDTLSNFVQKGN